MGAMESQEMEAEDEKAILYGLRPVNLYGPQGKAPLNAFPPVPGPLGSVLSLRDIAQHPGSLKQFECVCMCAYIHHNIIWRADDNCGNWFSPPCEFS